VRCTGYGSIQRDLDQAVRCVALNRHPDTEAAAGRLLKNQEDIGNAVASYYGPEAGPALTDLLKQHIMIAVDLVDAAIKGDQDRFATEDKRWDETPLRLLLPRRGKPLPETCTTCSTSTWISPDGRSCPG
jgi:hypothetical protein